MTTISRSAFDIPLYANKPRRRVPGTDAVAVTMHRSTDGSIREYAVFSADGEGRLGTAHYHPRRPLWAAGYTLDRVRSINSEQWPNLAAFATEMAKRLGIEA